MRETSETARTSHILEVEIDRVVLDEDEGDPVSWAATWGLREDSVGYEDSSENLPELIDAILDDARTSWGQRYDLRIEWILGGDAPTGRPLTTRSPLLGSRCHARSRRRGDADRPNWGRRGTR